MSDLVTVQLFVGVIEYDADEAPPHGAEHEAHEQWNALTRHIPFPAPALQDGEFFAEAQIARDQAVVISSRIAAWRFRNAHIRQWIADTWGFVNWIDGPRLEIRISLFVDAGEDAGRAQWLELTADIAVMPAPELREGDSKRKLIAELDVSAAEARLLAGRLADERQANVLIEKRMPEGWTVVCPPVDAIGATHTPWHIRRESNG